MVEIFETMWDGRLGQISIAKNWIQWTPREKPVHWAPLQAGPENQEFEGSCVDKMLEMKVAEMAGIEWAAPTVFVPKKDGSLKLCLDSRKLDVVTEQDS